MKLTKSYPFSFRYVLVVCLILLFFAPLKISAEKFVTVGIYQNKPKIFLNEKEIPSGIFVDLLNEIAKQENWDLRYIPGTWNECLEHLRDATIDLMPDMAFSLSRSEEFDFNKITVIDSWSGVYADPRQRIFRLSDLSGKRISLVIGSVQEKTFSQLMNGFGYSYTMIPANSFENAFSHVKIGLADAAVANHLFGETHYSQYGLNKTLIVFNPVSLHFAVKKGFNIDLINTIDHYLDRWIGQSNSFYYQSISSYLDLSREQRDHKVFWFIIFPLSLLFILAVLLLFLFRKKLTSGSKDLIETDTQLRQEKDKFQNYIEHAPLGIFVTDIFGNYIEVNQAACDITGYDRDELIGKNISNLIPPEEHADAIAHFDSVTTKGKASGKFTFIHHSGKQRIWTVEAVKISEDRFLGFVSDITEKERDRARINRLGKLIESTLNEIYIFEPDSLRIIETNKAALDHTGYSRDEILKLTPLDLNLDLTPAEFENFILPLKEKRRDIVIFESRHYRKDKTFYEVEVHLQIIEYENESLFTAIVLDISKRKETEAELKAFKDQLEKKVEEKTKELRERVAELEHFHEVTIEREIRMKEISDELKALKGGDK